MYVGKHIMCIRNISILPGVHQFIVNFLSKSVIDQKNKLQFFLAVSAKSGKSNERFKGINCYLHGEEKQTSLQAFCTMKQMQACIIYCRLLLLLALQRGGGGANLN